ncbi:somatostatin receptor type 5-like [Oculina patagonica]
MNNSTSGTSLPNNDLRVIIWCVTYGLVAAVTVTGNALTIAVFSKKKLPRKFGGYFLINLAVADLMVGALALPMYIYIVYAFSSSPTNKNLVIFQQVYTVVDVFTGLASVFTLASIALERLYGVLYPIRYRWKSKRNYFVAIAAVWVISATASIAYILSTRSLLFLLPEATFTYYLTVISVLSVLVICAAYVVFWLRVHFWNKRKMEMVASKQEKRLATALFIVTVVFVLMWTPFHVMNILVNFTKSFLYTMPVDLVFFGKLLHYSNSLANPAIYSLKMPEFRLAIRRMFCKNWVRETRV